MQQNLDCKSRQAKKIKIVEPAKPKNNRFIIIEVKSQVISTIPSHGKQQENDQLRRFCSKMGTFQQSGQDSSPNILLS